MSEESRMLTKEDVCHAPVNRMAYAALMVENEVRNILDTKEEGMYIISIHGCLTKFDIAGKQIHEIINGKPVPTFVEPSRLRQMQKLSRMESYIV